MKALYTTALVLIASGCAHLRPESHGGVSVQTVPHNCLDLSVRGDALVEIINGPNGQIAFPIFETSGPPYNLFPYNLEIVPVDAEAKTLKSWRIANEDYVAPSHEVKLDPSDRAQFRVYSSISPTATSPGTFRLRVKDAHGLAYESEPSSLRLLNGA